MFSHYRNCGVDIQSQEAYELAVRGLLHPVGEIPPLILDAKCINFNPPDFELGKISEQCVKGEGNRVAKMEME